MFHISYGYILKLPYHFANSFVVNIAVRCLLCFRLLVLYHIGFLFCFLFPLFVAIVIDLIAHLFLVCLLSCVFKPSVFLSSLPCIVFAFVNLLCFFWLLRVLLNLVYHNLFCLYNKVKLHIGWIHISSSCLH